jgi:predicted flap endonuclease-1-like 5' DNA nuclease
MIEVPSGKLKYTDLEITPHQTPHEKRKYNIEIIEGIGPIFRDKLINLGIITTDDLLTFGGTRKDRQELSEKTGIYPKLILKWVNRADLMRVKGIGEEYSDLLEVAGVDTVKELQSNPTSLCYTYINQEKKL